MYKVERRMCQLIRMKKKFDDNVWLLNCARALHLERTQIILPTNLAVGHWCKKELDNYQNLVTMMSVGICLSNFEDKETSSHLTINLQICS